MSEGNYWTKALDGRLNRRRLLAGGAGLAGASLLACGRQSQSAGSPATGSGAQGGQETPRPGGTLNVYLTFTPPADPQKLSATGHQAIGGVYSRVFRFKTGPDPKVITDHDVEPDLGLSAESPDGVTWTVKLRPDAKFHNVAPVNAHPVEAEDIKATFTRFLNPATSAPNRGALDMIDPSQIQTPNKDTVIFKLNYPYAPFRKTLASSTYGYIYPREVLTGGYDPLKLAIGSGPFIMDTITPDVSFTYKRNPEWFEKGRPYVDAVKLAILSPDSAPQLAQFGAGNLDELLIRNPFDVDTARQQNPKATVLKNENASPMPMYFQMGDPTSVFQDIRVRRAFSMALERDVIGKVVYNGEHSQPIMVPSYMGKWSLKVQELPPDIQQYFKYNPAEAKKLLEAAGATNLQIRIGYPNTFARPEFVKHAETVANFLNAIGVKTSFWVHDYNKEFVDAGKGTRQGYFDKDVVMFASAGAYSDADEWLFAYFHSKSTSNQEHLKDPAYDAMVDKERTLLNEDERLKAVREITKYLADKMYLVSSGASYQWAFVQPRVHNYQYSNSLAVFTEQHSKLWLR